MWPHYIPGVGHYVGENSISREIFVPCVILYAALLSFFVFIQERNLWASLSVARYMYVYGDQLLLLLHM